MLTGRPAEEEEDEAVARGAGRPSRAAASLAASCHSTRSSLHTFLHTFPPWQVLEHWLSKAGCIKLGKATMRRAQDIMSGGGDDSDVSEDEQHDDEF